MSPVAMPACFRRPVLLRLASACRVVAAAAGAVPRGRSVLLALVEMIGLAAFAPWAFAQAAPGDIYYSAHVAQRFQYYVFADDYVTWADDTVSGTSLLYDAQHDTTTVPGTVHIGTTLDAQLGRLQLDVASEILADARTGIYYQTFDDVDLKIYVRGPSGTPYHLNVDTSGLLVAAREGGLPGTIQPVNGTSIATFEDSTLVVANGGTFSVPLDTFETSSGVTTNDLILVGGEVYSLAVDRIFTTFTSVTQALCILGCMTEEAHFHALSAATIVIDIYPYGDPTAVPDRAHDVCSVKLAAWPNPARREATVSFEAAPGSRAVVDVFNASGQRMTRLFDAIASRGTVAVRWDAAHVPSGVYFLRAEAGGETRTAKLTLLK